MAWGRIVGAARPNLVVTHEASVNPADEAVRRGITVENSSRSSPCSSRMASPRGYFSWISDGTAALLVITSQWALEEIHLRHCSAVDDVATDAMPRETGVK